MPGQAPLGSTVFANEIIMINGNAVQAAIFILGFSWIYHGLFPKLITVAPLEKALTGSFGFSAEVSTLITKSAGISEILFGAAIIAFYRTKALIWLNIAALLALLAFVAIQMPVLLIEAFNPVTTNLALVGLSYVLLCEKRI